MSLKELCEYIGLAVCVCVCLSVCVHMCVCGCYMVFNKLGPLEPRV